MPACRTGRQGYRLKAKLSGLSIQEISFWFQKGASLDSLTNIKECRLSAISAPHHQLLYLYYNSTKVPDFALFPRGPFWPTIVFEVRYNEPYDDLQANVKLLLEGSGGKITQAILIKLDPLNDGETYIQKGFLETWHLSDGKSKKDAGRKVISTRVQPSYFKFYFFLILNMLTLFPTPENHANQQLNLPLKDLFRNRFDNLTNEGWGKDDTVPLHLDDLRTAIEEGTWRHLVQNGILDDNDDSA